MTEQQRDFYMMLLMAGRSEEAEAYIENCMREKQRLDTGQESDESTRKRYLTAGVCGNVPKHLISLMWRMIDQMDAPEKDYLQIFELEKISGPVQIVRHWQEMPEYHSPLIYIPYGPYWTGKIYVIDGGGIATMCLPEER